MSVTSALGNVYFVYQFIKKLVIPFKNTRAYELGIIDEKGKVLKKRSSLKTRDEREAYTLSDTLIFNLKKILAKVPGGSSKFATFAAALFLLKEEKTAQIYYDSTYLEEKFLNFLEEQKLYNDEIDVLMEETINEYGEIEELSAGTGMIAGIGVGPDGEPPGITHAQKKKRKKFAGADVFVVDPKTFMKARFGKKKYAKYETYVGNDEIGQEIREYGLKNPGKPIVIQDCNTGFMCYLRYGKKK